MRVRSKASTGRKSSESKTAYNRSSSKKRFSSVKSRYMDHYNKAQSALK